MYTADHLVWLDDAAKDERGFRWMSARELCIVDAELARSLLKNEHDGLIEHSDFFGPTETALRPRAAQVAIAREVHALVQAHQRSVDPAASVERLGPSSDWPASGNLLMLEMMRPVIASSGRSPAFHRAVNRLVARRILGRFDRPRGRVARLVDRFRFANAVVREAADLRPRQPPADILDLLAGDGRRMSDETLIHIYAAFLFALVSSVGLTLAWAVMLAVRHGKAGAPPRHVVQEALRLYPITWLLERSASREMDIAGERVGPDTAIVISPYAVHRNPRYWPEPTCFLPERWAGRIDRRAWIPFGAGSQSCVAGSLSLELAAATLEALLARPVSVEEKDARPSIGAALAPGRFTLFRR
ncbi:MAG: hypothetical protein QOI38_623 [Sphingomonadales bacterium]|jgi:cytochrome P450|nr:hypothetical protein [Sphingomonadales bacterium]